MTLSSTNFELLKSLPTLKQILDLDEDFPEHSASAEIK